EELKTEVGDAVAEVKKALEGTDVDAIKGSAEKLAQISQKMGAAMYAQNPEGAQPGAEDHGPTADAQGGEPQDDEVVDAEIVDEDKPKGDAS
ncbi:molecular chaperone DnaK, partial [Actinomadura decatromicini]